MILLIWIWLRRSRSIFQSQDIDPIQQSQSSALTLSFHFVCCSRSFVYEVRITVLGRLSLRCCRDQTKYRSVGKVVVDSDDDTPHDPAAQSISTWSISLTFETKSKPFRISIDDYYLRRMIFLAALFFFQANAKSWLLWWMFVSFTLLSSLALLRIQQIGMWWRSLADRYPGDSIPIYDYELSEREVRWEGEGWEVRVALVIPFWSFCWEKRRGLEKIISSSVAFVTSPMTKTTRTTDGRHRKSSSVVRIISLVHCTATLPRDLYFHLHTWTKESRHRLFGENFL